MTSVAQFASVNGIRPRAWTSDTGTGRSTKEGLATSYREAGQIFPQVTVWKLKIERPEVQWRTERNAAQVIGCGGLVVAHFPLSDDFAQMVD